MILVVYMIVLSQLSASQGVFSTLKVPGYREQSGGATGRGRMGTMARGDGRARAWGAGVHTGYIATAYLYIPGCTPVTSPYSRPVP